MCSNIVAYRGWATSIVLRQNLIKFVYNDLKRLHQETRRLPSPEDIVEEIQGAFLRLDEIIVKERPELVRTSQVSKPKAAAFLNTALSGSCALLTFYNTKTLMFYVANTGDSRAVMGRRDPEVDGGWSVTQLTKDQTGSNKGEVERILAEHPEEEAEDVIRNGRLLGLEVTRAFGDAQWKWTQEQQDEMEKDHYMYSFGAHKDKIKTPPYLTAKPEVTKVKMEKGRGSFVVLACDGLWELLTNEEVVGIVGRWVDIQQGKVVPDSSDWHVKTVSLGDEEGSGQKKPSLSVSLNSAKDLESEGKKKKLKPEERFTLEEENAATCLVRNALGGKDDDETCALLSLSSPISRKYRDDLTIQVIFFEPIKTNDFKR